MKTQAPLTFVIQPCTISDINEVLRHRRSMFHDMGFTDSGALDLATENSRSFIERGLKEEWYHGWLVKNKNGETVGGGGVVVTEWTAHPENPRQRLRPYILNVYVYPEYRRLGIARAIMDLILEWCRAEQFSCVWLHASEFGRPLYEEFGFQQANEMKLRL